MNILKKTSAASVLPDCRRKSCSRVSTATRGLSVCVCVVSTATRGLSANGFRKNIHCLHIAAYLTRAVQ